MNDTCQVSIIIPCYNDGKYIMDAIQSAQSQTYPFVELIVVDDGSTDQETARILTDVEKSGIKVLHTDHKGPSAARNRGISEALGQYILPLDADDKIAASYLEKAIRILDDSPNIGVVYCYADMFGEKSGRWQIPDYSLSNMLVNNVVFVTALFRKEDWKRVGGFCEKLEHGLEDYDFWLSILELGREIYQIPEVLFYYRIKPTSRTTVLNSKRKYLQETYQIVFDNHKNLYKENFEIIIPALRNAWLEQVFSARKYEFVNKIINKLSKFPEVKKIMRWIWKKI